MWQRERERTHATESMNAAVVVAPDAPPVTPLVREGTGRRRSARRGAITVNIPGGGPVIASRKSSVSHPATRPSSQRARRTPTPVGESVLSKMRQTDVPDVGPVKAQAKSTRVKRQILPKPPSSNRRIEPVSEEEEDDKPIASGVQPTKR